MSRPRYLNATGIPTSKSFRAVTGSDRELMDYLASRWNSQGKGHHLMGAYFENTSGSFRAAIRAKMKKDQNAKSRQA